MATKDVCIEAFKDFREYCQYMLSEECFNKNLSKNSINDNGVEYKIKIEDDNIVVYSENVKYLYKVNLCNKAGIGTNIIDFRYCVNEDSPLSRRLSIFVLSFFQRLNMMTFFARIQDSTIENYSGAIQL